MADDRSIRVRLLADIGNYRDGLRQAAASTVDFGRQVSGMGTAATRDMERIGHSALLMAGGIAVGVGLAVKAAMDWESAWAGVTKTVDGTASEMSELEDGLRDLAKELPATHQEIAAVAEAAGALGIERTAIEGFTRTMIDLGETTNVTADQAATSMAQIANIMGTAQGDFDRMGSALVELGNNGASTEAEILEFANRLAAAGNIAGLTEADIFGLGSALASVGINAEAGGTAMSKVLTTMSDAVLDGGDKLETFAATAGMSASSFASAYRDDAGMALNAFVEGLGRMIAAGESTTPVFAALALEDSRLTNAMKSLAGSQDIVATSLADGRRAWEENTALTDEAAKRYETTAAQLGMLRNQVVDFAIDVGGELIPVLKGAADGASTLLAGFRELPGPLSAIGGGLGLLTFGLTGAVGIMGTFGPKIAAAKKSLESLGAGGEFVSRNMGKMAGALGIAGIAMAGLSLVLGRKAQEEADAKAAAEAYTAVIEEQGRAIGVLTDQLALQNILEGDLGKSLREAGADLDIFSEALRKGEGPSERLANRLELASQVDLDSFAEELEGSALASTTLGQELLRLADAGDLTAEEMGDLVGRLQEEAVAHEDGATAAENNATATEASGAAAADSAAGHDAATEAIDAETAAIEALDEELTAYLDHLKAITDPLFGFEDAINGVRDAQLDYGDALAGITTAEEELATAIAEHGEDSAEAATAARNLEDAYRTLDDAQRGTIRSAQDYDAAITTLGTALRANPGLLDDAVAALQRWVDQGVITQAQADAEAEAFRVLAGVATAVPDSALIEVDADTAAAEAKLRALRTSLQGFANNGMIVAPRTNVVIREATGGIVPGIGDTDSVEALLTPGEFVIRKQAAQALGYDRLFALNRLGYATGGIAGQAAASETGYEAQLSTIASSGVGRAVVAGLDAGQARQALEGLTDAYRDLIFRIGVAAGEQVLWMSSSEEQFDRMAGFASDAADRLDVMFDVGDLGTDEYLAILQERLAGTELYSNEWADIWGRIDEVQEKRVDEQRRLEDDLHEIGTIGNADYKAILEARLADTEQFSDEWFDLWKQITQITQDAADEQARIMGEIRDAQRGVTDSAISDLSSVYQAARDEAAETGEGFEAVLVRHLAAWRAAIAETQAAEAWAAQYAGSLRPSTLASLYPGQAQAVGDANLAQFMASPYVQSYDTGGWLQPGWTMAYNGTGAPERVGNDDVVGGAGGQLFGDVYVAETADVTSMFQRAAIARKSKRL